LWGNIEKGEKELSKEDYRVLLEKCKVYYEEKSADLEQDITKTAEEKKTLANKISSFRSKIQNLNYQISQSNIMIKDLGVQIEDTQGSITQTSLKIEEIRERLALNVRLRYEEDQKSTIEILLAEETLSGFF